MSPTRSWWLQLLAESSSPSTLRTNRIEDVVSARPSNTADLANSTLSTMSSSTSNSMFSDISYTARMEHRATPERTRIFRFKPQGLHASYWSLPIVRRQWPRSIAQLGCLHWLLQESRVKCVLPEINKRWWRYWVGDWPSLLWINTIKWSGRGYRGRVCYSSLTTYV